MDGSYAKWENTASVDPCLLEKCLVLICYFSPFYYILDRLLVESDCRVEDIPHSLAYNMVVTQMAKDEKTNHQVLKQALAVVQDNLSSNISQAWQEISDLLWSWHNYVCDKYPIISDHALYRSLNGIISCVPDEIDCNDDLLKFVFSELLNEYSPFISRYV